MVTPTRITMDAVRAPIYHVTDTPSTLDLAATLLADTATATPHLTTIIADSQSAGRGRLGRSWITPPGQALLASTIISLPSSLPAEALGWTVHACALAVRDALTARLEPLGRTVTLKWPNDVLVDGTRKICGILAQLAPASSPYMIAVILGYGINIAQEAGTMPTAQATSLLAEGDKQAGTAPTSVAHALLGSILTGLDERIRSLITHGDAANAGLLTEAEQAMPLIGTRIVLASPTDAHGTPAREGIALGLAPTGALLLRTDDGTTEEINAGDVLTTGTPLTLVHDTKEKRANN
ncbi:biotin--[acetyl-CoA-carboxylase] ligase [Actinomyces bouchesdurhonensis]|uniref:biotin--[acetyl-CoA-carboxylase] ligase n=1 Tax=Actinomyces bouchesdurhonensis TaxID=1852361 RepID=UPI003AF039A4